MNPTDCSSQNSSLGVEYNLYRNIPLLPSLRRTPEHGIPACGSRIHTFLAMDILKEILPDITVLPFKDF